LEDVKPKRSLEATILRLKVTLFWLRHESKKVTGTGHYAWPS
jgi:cAMP phosphodiesterase